MLYLQWTKRTGKQKARTSCPFSFAKVNMVNEASAFDQITGRESGAFCLPQTGSEDDDLKLRYIKRKNEVNQNEF